MNNKSGVLYVRRKKCSKKKYHMKYLLCGLLLLGTSAIAAVTNDLTPSDVSARIFDSDYGALPLAGTDIVSAPQWDTSGEPPISAAAAMAAVTKQIPPPKGERRALSSINLENFDGKGWYYLVVYEDYRTLSREGLRFVVTNRYTAVVLMDGRVLAPSEKTNVGMENIRK